MPEANGASRSTAFLFMPTRLGLEYVGADDQAHPPVMIHRAVLGSLERFMGVFIEHYAGYFLLWAAPTQVRLEADLRNEKLGFKIREAQLAKIPYMVVIGDKEKDSATVAPRKSNGDRLAPLSVGAFVDKIKEECGPQWEL